MPEASDSRVAVYIDFDNIVISRYDQVNGRGSFMKDRNAGKASAAVTARLKRSTVDIGAIIDFAASLGTIVLTRAYADWSAQVNADYRSQLVARAVDLVQLFPAAAYGKNGADIRLAVDAVEDMFRLPDLTHVVIVAGDSDYIALAQRCRRLGRVVVGVGVTGSTAKSLAAACDEFASYDRLPGVPPVPAEAAEGTDSGSAAAAAKGDSAAAKTDSAEAKSGSAAQGDAAAQAEPPATKPATRRASKQTGAPVAKAKATPTEPDNPAAGLLERALRLESERVDDDWINPSALKDLLKRMDPSFSEKELGHRSFLDFVRAHPEIAEVREEGTARYVRFSGR